MSTSITRLLVSSPGTKRISCLPKTYPSQHLRSSSDLRYIAAALTQHSADAESTSTINLHQFYSQQTRQHITIGISVESRRCRCRHRIASYVQTRIKLWKHFGHSRRHCATIRFLLFTDGGEWDNIRATYYYILPQYTISIEYTIVNVIWWNWNKYSGKLLIECIHRIELKQFSHFKFFSSIFSDGLAGDEGQKVRRHAKSTERMQSKRIISWASNSTVAMISQHSRVDIMKIAFDSYCFWSLAHTHVNAFVHLQHARHTGPCRYQTQILCTRNTHIDIVDSTFIASNFIRSSCGLWLNAVEWLNHHHLPQARSAVFFNS